MLSVMSTNHAPEDYPMDAFEGIEDEAWPPFESEEEEEKYWSEFKKDIEGEPW